MDGRFSFYGEFVKILKTTFFFSAVLFPLGWLFKISNERADADSRFWDPSVP
jgi:hypothetical protein